jgi:GT2 family glycosyltransferase
MAPSASKNTGVLSVTGTPSKDSLDAVSVVICTKDRPDDLAQAIASIRDSGEAGHGAEIIVVEEADCPREIPGVRCVHLPREGRGFGYARNVGLREARRDLIVFIDDDCEAERGWLEALTGPLREDAAILGVAGAVLVRGCGSIGYAENTLGFPGGGLRYLHEARGQVVPTRTLSTCNCAYRQEAILRAGGFPENTRLGGEDFLLAERISAAGPCVYSPEAIVYHRPRGRLHDIFSWFARRGQSDICIMRASPTPGSFVRFFLRSSWTVRTLGVLAILTYWPQLLIYLPLAVCAYYGGILWRYRFVRAYPSHRHGWWLVPIVKLTMDLGAELGRWKGLISRRTK